MALTNLIIGFSWIAFALYWFASAFTAKPGTAYRFSGQGFLIRVVGFFIIYLVIAEYGRPLPLIHNEALEALGALLTLVGIGLAIWARMTIGRNWGMPMSEKVETEIVTTGPYKYVRHPIYSSVLLAIFGSALATSTAWFIIFIAGGAYFVYSATVEEKRMMEKFPTEYGEYKSKTKMLIPFIF